MDKEVNQRFITSLCLACNVNPDTTKHVQIVITADENEELHCYFDVVDPTKLPKFAEE